MDGISLLLAMMLGNIAFFSVYYFSNKNLKWSYLAAGIAIAVFIMVQGALHNQFIEGALGGFVVLVLFAILSSRKKA